ncbi:MAG: bi-domain-containing oxidoreductase [Nitrospinaceae bacterium]
MKQVLVKHGEVVVETVPAPRVEPGSLLVAVRRSCISPGAELAGLSPADPLWKRALRKPQAVKNVMQMAAAHGITHTRNIVEGKLAEGVPIGYSAAGVVLEKGKGVTDLESGDRVACAGAQCAYHAELIRVPRNLAAPIPADLDFGPASTVGLGAIAMQGVRRADPQLGEVFVVLGLGLLGQITAQILRLNGCRVIGTDLDPERRDLAVSLGLDQAMDPELPDWIGEVHHLTAGHGADGVIVAAASPAHDIISQAFKLCRQKGRVVLLGAVGLNLNREDLYAKELDFFISTSYGPGVHDPDYEEKGKDYPIGYVRWTENRNMAEYLRLLAAGKIQVEALIQATFPVSEVQDAYRALKETPRPLGVLLSYEEDDSAAPDAAKVILNPMAKPCESDRIQLALVGGGNFLKAMHLPNLQAMEDQFFIRTVVSRTGANAAGIAIQTGALQASTDLDEALDDPDLDAVLIATRNNLHADMALQALGRGKHVFLEKPLALTRDELDSLTAFFEAPEDPKPLLFTGFNRRFSPFCTRIGELLEDRRHPLIINYRMNAGVLPPDHWVRMQEGGGRNLGEACHIYDLFTFITQSRVTSTQAQPVLSGSGTFTPQDNFVASFTFEEGSVATLTYTALGNSEYPRERMEVFAEGKVFFLDDYRQLTVFGQKNQDLGTRRVDKGHQQELQRFAHAVRTGGAWPIPLWHQIQATEMALEVERQLSGN